MRDDRSKDAEFQAAEAIGHQLEHFRRTVPPCRGMQLPDGLILRPTLSRSLFFYLRTRVEEGKIKTQVFASDSPYDRQKAGIGSVVTAMFDEHADRDHLEKLEGLIRRGADFVQEDPAPGPDFDSFPLAP